VQSRAVLEGVDQGSLMAYVTTLADAFGPHFGAVQRSLDKVWNKLVEMRVIEEGTS
jgi:hypothetical protein